MTIDNIIADFNEHCDEQERMMESNKKSKLKVEITRLADYPTCGHERISGILVDHANASVSFDVAVGSIEEMGLKLGDVVDLYVDIIKAE